MTALSEFESGWNAGWAGQNVPKGASIEYRNAHKSAVAARREADFYERKGDLS